jgi:ankyrin repeat protein
MRGSTALAISLLLLLARPAAAGETVPEGPRPGKHPLGIGEPRAPEPFTLEQRYLDAARRGDRATLERALELGVAVDAKDDLQRSALLLVAKEPGSLELVKLLHARGAALDEADLGGRTPFSWAAAEGHLEVARWLADQGAQVDRPDGEGRTPLFHTVGGGHAEIVSFLLDRGADPNRADRFRDTPLMLACVQGRSEIASLLLRRGADPSLRNQEGRTAADRAQPGTEVCRTPQAP